MKKSYASIRGTYDFGPPQTSLFHKIAQKSREIFRVRGYEEIILPVLEEASIFIRGVGRTTDIVEKQIFKVVRADGQQKQDIVLRPEATAQVVRYYLQNNLQRQSQLHKFFYIGAMFRGERPQKGRLRQFHHIGAEVIGSASVDFDAEIINVALKILDVIGIKDRELQINNLGCSTDKEKFSKNLKSTLAKKRNSLCQDCQRRLDLNPLRVLDCKKEACKKIVTSLDVGQNHLCDDCASQFEKLRANLDSLGIEYNYKPTLVRGLDYYTNTVFEIVSKELGSQDAIGAGGRYNSLVKDLGGPDIPATGFALGVERILLLLPNPKYQPPVKAYFASTSESLNQEALQAMEKCRESGIAVDAVYFAKSLKSQLKLAQKKGAKNVVIFGEDEWKNGSLVLRDMDKSTQKVIKRESLISVLKEELKTNA